MQESSVAFNLAERVQSERAARAAYWLSAVMGLGLIGCAALYFGALRPALESTRVLATEAQALAQERAHALEQLRGALAAGAAEAVTPVPAPATSPSVPVQAEPSRNRRRPEVQAPTTPGGEDGDVLGDLDLDSDDPFEDPAERPGRRGQTRRR